MEDDLIIFPCGKCGKDILRPEARAGVLVGCSKCGRVQKTRGIGTQPQATKRQVEMIELCVQRMASWLRTTVIFFILVHLLGFVSGLAGVPYALELAQPLWLTLPVVLLYMLISLATWSVRACRFLGRSPETRIFLCLFLIFGPPIGIIWAYLVLRRLRDCLWLLKEKGTRDPVPVCPAVSDAPA